MNQTNNILFSERYTPFAVKGNYCSLGTNYPLSGEMQVYNDGKVVGVTFGKEPDSLQGRKIILGVEDDFRLNLWMFSQNCSGDLFSLIREGKRKIRERETSIKYHGGRGSAPFYFDELMQRIGVSRVSQLCQELETKPVKEVLGSLGGINKSLIDRSFGRIRTAETFINSPKSNLELLSLI